MLNKSCIFSALLRIQYCPGASSASYATDTVSFPEDKAAGAWRQLPTTI
jgi:hypothetical protein